MRFFTCHRGGLLRWALLSLLSSLSEVHGNCGSPERISYAELIGTRQESYPVGTVLQYRCLPGYENIPGTTPSIQCQDDSTWSTPSVFCRGKQCRPLDIENGRIVSEVDLRLGDEITFACETGYRLIGEKSVRCVARENLVDWDKEPPYCQIIPCFPPSPITNGIHTENDEYVYGNAVTYKCNAEFSLIGNATITCTTAENGIDGKWSGPAPECKVVQCKRPQIQNGNVAGGFQATYTYEKIIMIECNAGHTVAGNNFIKCGADNLWQPAIPTCVKGIITPTGRPGDETTGSGKTIGIAVGAVLAVIFVIAAIIVAVKCKDRLKKGKTASPPASPKSYHVAPDKDPSL
ncbi:C4b-binding protein alpha chain-like [Elgaria multicarinata webbii]|uniref:C4b-binding protein alpha chain-like n=1 Tax=Elgaria multicarinata webbii TaxID=159646 RepID=UPI002FCD49AD